LNVAVTLSVAVSIIDTVPDPSFDAYAIGAAKAADEPAAESVAAAMRILTYRMERLLLGRIGYGAMEAPRTIGYPTRLCRELLSARMMATLVPCGGRGTCRILRQAVFLAIAATPLPNMAVAQDVVRIDPLVITATRVEERAFDLPVAIDSVGTARIQQGQLQINLSESLSRVPGLVVQNRWNYAQDLQVSSRGFGARAAFGVRGIRLYQDGIPATMPDGQGQTGSFSLVSAQRIEVLRGPFSTLYGNASGGVISVFTEDGPPTPTAQAEVVGSSYGTWNAIAKFGGEEHGINYLAAANHFATNGYREHSEASRDQSNAKIRFNVGEDTRVTMIVNTLYQPEAQDPLGLTRAEWEANPRQADPAATQFNTRKTVGQQQGGVTIERSVGSDTTLRLTGYGGQRTVRQYLALAGTGDTSSGGVTDLSGNFSGIDLRATTRMAVAGRPLTLTVGVDYDRQQQARKGYVNNNGSLGDLRRDEDDTVRNQDVYAQAEWGPLDALSLLAGARYSDVRFDSDDHYITALNPDDSGGVAFSHASPVVGAVWHAARDVNVYANWGEGFETPTFIELAYRNVGTGLNFALQPAISRSTEAGIKALLPNAQRVNLAAFSINTSNEIIIDASTGGRTTYKNAGRTRRRGVEAQWEGALGGGVTAYAAYTYLSAKFAEDTTTGTPPQLVPAGSRLPGVPAASAYAELAWTHAEWGGFSAALEAQYADKVYVNERNTDAAPSYAVANVRAGFEQRVGMWTLRQFARVNNLTDRNYVGSVIIGDTNGRFFEPAARRNYLIGASANVVF
jgi:iron complex outermembrane receptor protein